MADEPVGVKEWSCRGKEAAQHFYDSGLVFAVNRFFLHRYGFAIAVVIDDETGAVMGLEALRDDKETIVFGKEQELSGFEKFIDYLKKGDYPEQ